MHHLQILFWNVARSQFITKICPRCEQQVSLRNDMLFRSPKPEELLFGKHPKKRLCQLFHPNQNYTQVYEDKNKKITEILFISLVKFQYKGKWFVRRSFLKSFIVQNQEMKRTISTKKQSKQADLSSEPSMDCSCEILNDTSLSNIGDSECDCSQCLEANLNAFNQFKNDQQLYKATIRNARHNERGRSAMDKRGNGDGKKETGFKSTDKYGNKQSKTRLNWGKKLDNEERYDSEYDEQREWEGNSEEFNDFLMITRHRIRKYIDQRNQLQKQQNQQKQKLKDKIKKNLQILKYTAQLNRNCEEAGEINHAFKWNHSKYRCQCNGKQEKHKCCRDVKIKEKLDTGLDKLKENFCDNRDQILEQIKEKRIAQMNKDKGLCPHDQCPNHHNRTDPKKIRKIEKFIKKQAKKYSESLKEQKRKQEEAKKVREAKLRAIDIKSRQMAQKSKKYDPNQSRTTFRLSIDQFDTFSELGKEAQRKKQMEKAQRQVKKNLRQGGGALQNAIYEQFEEEQDMPRPGQNIILKKTTKGQMPNLKGHKQYSEKILYDAKIGSPKNIQKKQKKVEQSTKKQQTGKKKSHLNKKKQEEERKRIQEQIERKRKQLLKEYSKRNTNKQPANRQIRQEYEKTEAKKGKTTQNSKKQGGDRDPYRNNYKYQAGKDVNQINAHGDPLLQEYVYHDGKRVKAAASMAGDEIFTQNINSLTSKNQLRL